MAGVRAEQGGSRVKGVRGQWSREASPVTWADIGETWSSWSWEIIKPWWMILIAGTQGQLWPCCEEYQWEPEPRIGDGHVTTYLQRAGQQHRLSRLYLASLRSQLSTVSGAQPYPVIITQLSPVTQLGTKCQCFWCLKWGCEVLVVWSEMRWRQQVCWVSEGGGGGLVPGVQSWCPSLGQVQDWTSGTSSHQALDTQSQSSLSSQDRS